MKDFELLWNSIIRHAGEPFHTIRGLPFIYQTEREYVIIIRSDSSTHRIIKSQFEKSAQVKALQKPSDISHSWGSSYVFAILTDKRIRKF
jgi:hypothetical protein